VTKKGVRVINGYRVIFDPNHPSAMKSENWKGYVYEHIKVASDCLGRLIKKSEVVRHLNGDRSDNRHQNLIVLERSQHVKLHKWLEGASGLKSPDENGVNSGKPTSIICFSCGISLQDKQTKYCSNRCRGLVERSGIPAKEELLNSLSSMSIEAVGRKHHVSGNAVRKWMNKYGIDKAILSQAGSTLPEGAETTGGVQSP
jgi:hypothetical protein